MKTPRTILLVAFFLGLAALEIAHGVSRIHSIRSARKSQILEELGLRHDRLGDDLSPLLEHNGEFALHLAKRSWVIDLVRDSSSESAMERVRTELPGYLEDFRDKISEVRVIDATAVEVARCSRNVGGKVVMTLPAAEGAEPDAIVGDAMSDVDVDVIPDRRVAISPPDLETVMLVFSRSPGEVVRGGVIIGEDSSTYNSGAQQVLEYATAIRDVAGEPVGVLVLTAYASPFLNQVRSFEPFAGTRAFLMNQEGLYLAHRDPDRELGGLNPSTLAREHEDVAERIFQGDRMTEGQQGVYFATRLESATTMDRDRAQDWTLVTWMGHEDLDNLAAVGVQMEYLWIIFSTLGVMLLIVLAMGFFMRLSNREIRLRESQYYLAKQREMERQLAIAERLASLGQLTAGVAHEINNPLEGIGNYLSLLEQDNLPAEKRTKFQGLVRHGFERIRDIVRDLSSFSRPDAAQDYADLSQVVRQSIDLVGYNKQFKQIDVRLQGFEEAVAVRGDPGRLEQVFINLFVNAARAIDGPGAVTVTARREESDAGEDIVVTVEDDGPGVPEELLEQIFDPFFSTTDGTGLGLAVSFSIVRVHGGHLTVENMAAGGARFTVRLPAHRTAAESSPERTS